MSSPATQRILVVDDETIVVSLVRDALEDEEYEVLTASNGQDALTLLSREQIQLLVTDIRMPNMDGIELVRRARENQPDLSVIFMTGYANLNSAKNAIKQGAFDYIMKPFELSEIRTAVRNAFKTKAAAAEKTQTQELNKLSDLSQMLFTTNDRASLVTSSLKFIMMHLHVTQGAAMFCDKDNNTCITVTVEHDAVRQQSQSHGPMAEALQDINIRDLQYPFLVSKIEDHPVYRAHPHPEIRPYLYPDWATPDKQLIVVPVMRAEALFGWFLLGTNERLEQIKEGDLKFLTITASQLAITLENLTLLEETQKAYAGLKELQDETIRLEKIATRGQMSAEIGHELNNFLGVVAGNLQLLDFQLRKGNYQELGRYVTAMSETIEKIKIFTANLMDLTPISSKKEVLRFDKLMAEVIEYVRPQKRFQGVQIRVSGLAHELPFEADSTQLQQLLYNLLNNAADAMAESPRKEITISVKLDEVQNRFITQISDTGCGFSPELLAKAFSERFTTKKLGHGFGLVVCKRIIENHGGHLQVESQQGVGTVISIDFPIAQFEAVPA